MNRCRLVATVVSAVGLAVGCALTATAQTPPGGVPDIPGIPGQETARFKVVVEGDTFASATIQGTAGEDVGCVIKVSPLTIVEEVRYGRGKGVTMEFVRFKAAGRSVVSLQRAGRKHRAQPRNRPHEHGGCPVDVGGGGATTETEA